MVDGGETPTSASTQLLFVQAVAWASDWLAAHGWHVVLGLVAMALLLPALRRRLAPALSSLDSERNAQEAARFADAAAAARERQQAALAGAARQREQEKQAEHEERVRLAKLERERRTTGGSDKAAKALEELAKKERPKPKSAPSYRLGGAGGSGGGGGYRPGGPSARYRGRGG
jgi:hypothetical protein